MPLPVVKIPTMASPGNGWQHLAIVTAVPASSPSIFSFGVTFRVALPVTSAARLLDNYIGVETLQNTKRGQPVLANQREDLVDAGDAERRQNLFERTAPEGTVIFAECLLDQRASDAAEFGNALRAVEPSDGRFRPARLHETFPFGARLGLACRLDLDLIAVLQFGRQLARLAVDANADAGFADLRMDGIGKIHRRGPARKGDQIARGVKQKT